MRRILAPLIFVALVASASAEIGVISFARGNKMIIWSSVEAYETCDDEKKVHAGQPGPLCLSGIVGFVPNGTKLRFLGDGDGTNGWAFKKVRIIEGPSAGVVGIVPGTDYHRIEK